MIFVKITKGWICFARSFLLFQWWLSRPQRTPGCRRTSSCNWRSSDLRCKFLKGMAFWVSALYIGITYRALTLQVSRLYLGQLNQNIWSWKTFFFNFKWFQVQSNLGTESGVFIYLTKWNLKSSWDGTAHKGACGQAWLPEFSACYLCGRMRTPSCLVAFWPPQAKWKSNEQVNISKSKVIPPYTLELG